MIELAARDDGVLLPVRARAGARRTTICGEQSGALKVTVTQAPERGKANLAISRLLAKELGLKKSQIELVAGTTAPQKKFLIHEISIEELSKRIAARTPHDHATET